MSHDFDTRLRTAWHDAGEAITPSTQGRLRVARRTALAGTAARRSAMRWIAVPAGAFAAVAAVALLAPRLPTSPTPAAPVAASGTPVVDAAVRAADADADSVEALALEDDPDFYLWLDGIAPPAGTEVRHDPS